MSNSILADFREKLVADTTMFDLVKGRIAELPMQSDEPVPWLGYRRISEDGDLLLDSDGIVTTNIEVKCRAETSATTDEVRRQLATYRRFRGTMGTRSVKCIDVYDADNTEDASDPPGGDGVESTVSFRVEIIHDGP